MKVFRKLVVPFLLGVVRHAQIANQIVDFLEGQYLIKDLMDCLDFLHG